MKIIIFIFALFLCIPANASVSDKTAIEIIPLGSVDSSLLDYLKNNLSGIFDAGVEISQTRPLPEFAYNAKRRQFSSSRILEDIFKVKDNRPGIFLAVIDKDLYASGHNFVFGEASPAKGVSIVSLTRLYPEYYGRNPDKNLLSGRMLKEATHEIGHLFNLGHCPNRQCVMHFSNSISDTDLKDYHFCNICKKLLEARKTNLKN